MQDNQDDFKRDSITRRNHAGGGFHDGSGIFIVSSDMVRQLGSAGWLIAMWAHRTYCCCGRELRELSLCFQSGRTVCIY
jgi:hypothetical protein